MVKKEINWTSSVRGDILKHLQNLSFQFETRANWLIGISSILLGLLISNLTKIQERIILSGFIVIIVGCLFCIYNLIFILVPNIYGASKNISEKNLFSYGNIRKNYTKEQLITSISKLGTSSRELNIVFGDAIYWLSSKKLPYLSRKLKIGGWSLLISLIIGSIIILIGLFNTGSFL